MQILEIKQTQWLEEAKNYLASGKYCIFRTVIETPVTLVYRKSQVDVEVCKSLGYDIYEAYYNGGTLVANAGDLAFAHFYSVDNEWRERFVRYFINWLVGRGLNAEYDRNDILVDGYKVCATCVTRYGRIDYTTIFVGMSTNLEHIKQICKKRMEKVPKGLSEYGITSEEVEQMFLDFCNQDNPLIKEVK